MGKKGLLWVSVGSILCAVGDSGNPTKTVGTDTKQKPLIKKQYFIL